MNLKSTNPVLKKTLTTTRQLGNRQDVTATSSSSAIIAEKMTVAGAINKTLTLFGILLITTLFAYQLALPILQHVGMIGAFGVGLFTNFKPKTSPIMGPIYAALLGLFVGTISIMYASVHAGIIFQAVMLTFGTLLTMLMIYKFEIIKVTDKFRSVVSMAVGAIMLAYVVSYVMSLMGMQTFFLHQTGMLGIGICVVILGVASLNLLLDFDNFVKGEAAGAPKYMEWNFGMGLLFTLVWLYAEFLRLLSLLSSE